MLGAWRCIMPPPARGAASPVRAGVLVLAVPAHGVGRLNAVLDRLHPGNINGLNCAGCSRICSRAVCGAIAWHLLAQWSDRLPPALTLTADAERHRRWYNAGTVHANSGAIYRATLVDAVIHALTAAPAS